MIGEPDDDESFDDDIDDEEEAGIDAADFVPPPEHPLASKSESHGALSKLVSISKGNRQKTHGPTGKVVWRAPSISEQLKASETLLRLYGERLDDLDATEIIRGGRKKTPAPNGKVGAAEVRHLARQIAAAIIETDRDERGERRPDKAPPEPRTRRKK